MKIDLAESFTARRIALVATFAVAVFVSASVGAQAAGFTPLYQFKGGAKGAGPYGALVADKKGVLYGTTAFGGTHGRGTVFSLTHKSGNTWNYKVIYNFAGGPDDGGNPMAGVIVDGQTGALYGTTSGGGKNDRGIAFALTRDAESSTGWSETFLYSFKGGNDGAEPMTALLQDAETGVIYGVTYAGGGSKNKGTAFTLTPKNSSRKSFTEDVIYRFAGGSEGANPNGALIFSSKGDLLGTNSREGVMSGQCGQDNRGCGTVFLLKKASPLYSRTILHKFAKSNDGMEPIGPLVLDGSTLYGATRLGGVNHQGSIFKMDVSGSGEALVYSFKANKDGKGPWGVILASNNHLFGLTEGGGNAGGPVFGGTLFEVTKGGTEHVRHRFTGGSDGSTPQGTLYEDKNGVLFGLAFEGGNGSSSGAFFQYEP